VAENKSHRVQWMLNIDTLTKSKADAEEERQANKNSAADGLYAETQSSRFSRQRNAPVDAVSPMEDRSITVEHYLMYNNPLAITSPQYRFVSDLLRTGKLLNLLPSATACHSCFSSESRMAVNTESTWTSEHMEQVTESQAKAWKEVIGDEVKRKRRSSQKSNREEVLRQWRSEGNTRLRSSQLRSDTVDWKFQTISEQFHLNYEQKAAFDIFTTPLKTLLLDKNKRVDDSPEPYLNNRCMFLSGSGGTGKSQVIHAIQQIFEQAGCNDMLVVSATTGCAANLIEGSTIDSICKFTRKRKITAIGVSYSDDESDTVTTIDNSWSIIKFLIVDEASMLGCYKLN
jgi:AAA domain